MEKVNVAFWKMEFYQHYNDKCTVVPWTLSFGVWFPETDNVLFEVVLHHKTLYMTVVVKGANDPQTKEIIKLLLKDINKVKQYTATHKIAKPKIIQDIIFPKNKINYFTEIYTPLEL